MLAIKANIPASTHSMQHTVLPWASPSSHLSHLATSNSPKKLQGWGRCPTLAKKMSPDKTLTPTHFILSQQCK